MPPEGALPLRHAVALGLLHGPTELTPVSSSAHIALTPWLLGWPSAQLDDELRKGFEVALHAGTAAALLLALRHEVLDAARTLDARAAATLVLSVAPAALAGLVLERPIEERLGTPASTAFGLLAGGAALALADLRGAQDRGFDDATPLDGLLLGLAQACALIPGASRNGMTLSAARARGFARRDANRLSRHVALPVIGGATTLKGLRLARRGLPRGLRGAFAAGVAASFASTAASVRLIDQVERDRSLAPFAAYRAVLALVVLRRRAFCHDGPR
jgi:undecaprenyl-diphosphatase